MRGFRSSPATFKGTRPRVGGRTMRGRPLVPSGPYRPPGWAWAAAGLAALVVAGVILSPSPSAPRLHRPAVAAPNLPTVKAPSLNGPSLSGVSAPGLSAPNVAGMDLHGPSISSPHVSGPHISVAAKVGAPHLGGPDLSIGAPDAPALHAPSFHLSFGWLPGLFAVCLHILIFLGLIPWWVILLAILIGRAIWVVWRRSRESGETEEPRL